MSNDQRLWREAATTYAKLRSAGLTIPWNDVLIATLVLEEGCRVYSVDPHFELIAKHLKLRLYRPGYNGRFQSDG